MIPIGVLEVDNARSNARLQLALYDKVITNYEALAGVILFPNGMMTVVSHSGGAIQPLEWATPRNSALGESFEVRMTTVSGDSNQGDATEEWLPLNTVRGWGVQEAGVTQNFVGTLEIRPVGGTALVSATLTMESIVDEVPLEAGPADFLATAVSFAQIDLSWTTPGYAHVGFSLERRIPADTLVYSWLATIDLGETTYEDTGLTTNTEYEYRIRAIVTSSPLVYSEYSTPSAATTLTVSSFLAVAGDMTGDVFALYGRTGDTYTMASNPDVNPAALCRAVSLTSDGAYIAVGKATANPLYFYSNDAGTMTKLADPGTLPLGTVLRAAWHANDTHLALLVDYADDGLLLYKRTGDTLALVDSGVIPVDTLAFYHMAWHPSNMLLASTGNNFPTDTWDEGLHIFTLSGDALTYVAEIDATGISGDIRQFAISSSGRYIFIGSNATSGSGRCGLCIWDGSDFSVSTAIDNITTTNGAIGYAAFSPDENYLAVATNCPSGGGPALFIYKRTGDDFDLLHNPLVTLGVTSSAYSLAWSSDSLRLVMGRSNSANRLTEYVRSGDAFTLSTTPFSPAYDGSARSVAFSLT